ncbi:hypothetical protein IC614_00250 [Allosphingosinicella flava]|uniref:Uncharacterized protein n=1 Tax=Allosphingosinicella flava TaxID=2771430 RepID=A0A7T2GJU9_9SPHN|nr:hypothetical protein [Sphingosinicella flava]QPQ55097.1 hypothetical protein IC614_00250 [Sphingosinicella flava]
MVEDTSDKSFLFIGEANPDAATSRLAVAQINYFKKMLESRPSNWSDIVRIIDEEDLFGVVVKLTWKAMERLCHSEYITVRDELFSRISRLPHLIFVHQSFFGIESASVEEHDGDYVEEFWTPSSEYFKPLDREKRAQVQAFFNGYDLNVVAYERNAEISIIASEFVQQHQSNMLFRFYVPKGTVWAGQTEQVLSLFRDYLESAAKIKVRQSTHATAAGTVYEFFGDGEVSQEAIAGQMESFGQLMDLCLKDPHGAETLLVAMGADRAEIADIVSRYTRQLRRIATDMRHEREKVALKVRQQLEGELVDAVPLGDLDAIHEIVNQMIPVTLGVGSFLTLGGHRERPLTLNYKPQFFENVHGLVASEVHGTQNIGPAPRELLELIDRVGGSRRSELRAAVHELEDSNSSPEQIVSAKGKLKAFVGRVSQVGGQKLLDVSSSILQAYLQQKLGIG